MSSTFSRRRVVAFIKYLLLITGGCLALSNIAADDSIFGTYSGDCVLNDKAMRVELEIVKNPILVAGGADAILAFFSKESGKTPLASITMRGGWNSNRQFSFQSYKQSDTFGGSFRLEFLEEGSGLKGTLSLVKREPIPLGTVVSVPLALSPLAAPARQEGAEERAGAGRDQAINRAEITGVYEGSYTANKKLFSSALVITKATGSELSAEFSFSAGANATQPLGSFKLKGEYNSADKTFKLSTAGSATSSGGINLAGMAGVFDSSTGKLEGETGPDKGTFELTRNEQKSAELQAKSAAEVKRFQEAPRSLAEAKSDDQRRLIIVRWFHRLKDDYPNLDLHHTVLNEIYPKALNLFQDEAFVPVFGKPFDSLSADERDYFAQLIRRLFATRETRDLLDGFGNELETPFNSERGTFSFTDVAPQVAFLRGLHPKWHKTMDQLQALPATSASFDKILALEKEGEESFKDLSPAELKQFHETVDAAKHRVAEGAVGEKLDAAISKANGIDGARALSRWPDEQKQLLSFASSQSRDKVNARINARIDELLEQPVGQEVQGLATLGRGIAAVTAGNKWYHHLIDTYGFAANRPAIEKALAQLQARRAADLAEAAPMIVEELGKQRTEESVDHVRADYFAVTGDERTETAAQIAKTAAKRKSEIQRERQLARYSPQERKWMDSDGKIRIPQVVPEPDEDDLRIGMLRTLEMMGGEFIDGHTVHYTNNPIAKMLGIYVIIRIDRVEKLLCKPVAGGFLVAYRAHLNCDFPDKFKQMAYSQPSLGGSMLQTLTSQLSGPQGAQGDRFELSDRGWWCPSMRDRQF